MKKLLCVVGLLLLSLWLPKVALAQDPSPCVSPEERYMQFVPPEFIPEGRLHFPECYLPITIPEIEALALLFYLTFLEDYRDAPSRQANPQRFEDFANDFLDFVVLERSVFALRSDRGLTAFSTIRRVVTDVEDNTNADCVSEVNAEPPNFEKCEKLLRAVIVQNRVFVGLLPDPLPLADTPERRARYEALRGATQATIDNLRTQARETVVEVLAELRVTENLPPDIESEVRELLVRGVVFSPAQMATEGASDGSYTVALDTRPSGEVTITPSSGDTSVVTLSPATLTFDAANWDTAQTVTLTGVQDDDADDESTTITHAISAPQDSHYNALTGLTPVVVSVTDDDSHGIVITPATFSFTEGGSGSYTVTLGSQPRGAVTITPSSSNAGAVTGIAPATLTFNAANWNTAQSVTLSAAEQINAAEESATITHAIRSDADSDYNGLTGLPSVAVSVTRTAGSVAEIANQVLLPQVTRAITNQITVAIAARVTAAAQNTPTPTLNFAGQSFHLNATQDSSFPQSFDLESPLNAATPTKNHATAIAHYLATHGESLAAGDIDIKKMFADSAFVLPLKSAKDGGRSSAAVWGGGDYRHLSDDRASGGIREWNGDLFSAQLGIDAQLRPGLLGGVAVSWHAGEFEFTETRAGAGEYELDLVSLNPYVGWRMGYLDLWASLGYGEGDIQVTIASQPAAASSDLHATSVGFGGVGVLWRNASTQLRAQGALAASRVKVEGSEARGRAIAPSEIDVSQARLVLELSQARALADGGTVRRSAELGVRHDAGDGDTGSGVVVGLGWQRMAPALGLTLAGNLHALVGRRDYLEWGVEGRVRVAGGKDGQGLAFELSPGYGSTERNPAADPNPYHIGQPDWLHAAADDATDTTAAKRDYRMRLQVHLGYGVSLRGLSGRWTPYSEMTLANERNRYSIGVRWAHQNLSLQLSSEQREQASATDNAYLLKGEVRF